MGLIQKGEKTRTQTSKGLTTSSRDLSIGYVRRPRPGPGPPPGPSPSSHRQDPISGRRFGPEDSRRQWRANLEVAAGPDGIQLLRDTF